MNKALVIHNPTSGQQSEQTFEEQVSPVLTAAGYTFEIRDTEGEGDAKCWAAEAKASGFDLVVAAGGDGTVIEVIGGVIGAKTDLPVAIVPLGTGNLLARAISLPLGETAALEAGLAGHSLAFDVGYLSQRDQYFMLSAGVGFDADVIEDADRDMKDKLGFFAYIWASIKNMFNRHSTPMTLTVDGDTRKIKAHTVMIFNAAQIKLGTLELGPGVNPHDGKLDIAVMRESSSWGTLGTLLRLFTGQLKKGGQPEHLRAKHIRLESRNALAMQADGEALTSGVLEATILPEGISLMVPQTYKPVEEAS